MDQGQIDPSNERPEFVAEVNRRVALGLSLAQAQLAAIYQISNDDVPTNPLAAHQDLIASGNLDASTLNQTTQQ